MAIFNTMLSEKSIFIYPADQRVSKDAVLHKLCTAVAENLGEYDATRIEALVQKREISLSTRLSPLLAVPHTIIPGSKDNSMAAAVIPQGIDWDTDRKNPVKLVVLLAGGRAHHLKILSELAAVLQKEELLNHLVAASDVSDFLSMLHHPEEIPDRGNSDRLNLSSLFFHEALRIRDSIESSRLILHADAIDNDAFLESLVKGTDVIVVTSREGRFHTRFSDEYRLFVMPVKGIKRSVQVQFTLLFLLSHKILDPADTIVNVFGQPGSGLLDSIRLTCLKDMDIPFSSETTGFPEDLEISTITRILQIATQLAVEGREGKPVGTLFVVGDFERVKHFTRQMIANPFHGYPRVDRNILDPSLEETVKEYARIDGAFIINDDGTIESAGTYVSGQPSSEEMHSGLGARHAAAQGISAVSSALAVAISESTRKIRVYKSGRLIMEI
jgi:diadenylate cyclase